MSYKSPKNKETYEATPKYNSNIHGAEVRKDKVFITTKKNYKKERELGDSYDEYTGKKFETVSGADLDHVIPIEKIYKRKLTDEKKTIPNTTVIIEEMIDKDKKFNYNPRR